MTNWIINFMDQFGYLGITFLIALENVFPPIPSEVILTFGGFMTTRTTLTVPGVVFFATIGSLLGAAILYGAGNILSMERMEKILDGKIGKVLHLKKEDIGKAYDWFNTKGKVTVLICRCIPIVRSLISIPAGMSGMNFGIFFLFTIIGSLVWNTVLVLLGKAASDSWEKIVEKTDTFTHITIIVLGVLFVAFVFWFYKKKKKEKDSNKN
ncbi:DedA family protein [Anaerocolumna xylanovorans]|uniref:LPXTG-motif cell wall anchor domain-containing protein n=1 Tax=Anaerocolumna xylanovorans DSM 12503 TaxID=1121345 RepID=A0A1M7Y024_9FIRM|nr:DedA family protein [Anaerocolumna xylanovorans]SHO44838.1 LPXTG-motif cell wall anchor domain-containing protein [Anaerocolumna xylanovorans DSM 12503]